MKYVLCLILLTSCISLPKEEWQCTKIMMIEQGTSKTFYCGQWTKRNLLK